MLKLNPFFHGIEGLWLTSVIFVEILDMALKSLQVLFYDNNAPHQRGVKTSSEMRE
ncbi:MAG TPA: hypothetical protein VKA09_03055 [Nitrososphaeraceae archaeon]|nr:hypothetical protein [Nitrososphaeraceae archaeon]